MRRKKKGELLTKAYIEKFGDPSVVPFEASQNQLGSSSIMSTAVLEQLTNGGRTSKAQKDELERAPDKLISAVEWIEPWLDEQLPLVEIPCDGGSDSECDETVAMEGVNENGIESDSATFDSQSGCLGGVSFLDDQDGTLSAGSRLCCRSVSSIGSEAEQADSGLGQVYFSSTQRDTV